MTPLHTLPGHTPGVAGQRGSFLDECRDLAAPGGSGQLGGGGAAPVVKTVVPLTVAIAPAAPDLPRAARGNEIPFELGTNPPLPREPGPEAGDAMYVYQERLGVADDLKLDTAIGSPAELVARREAARAAACVPLSAWPESRTPGVLDAALEAFAPLGGLTFGGLTAEPEGAPR